MPDEDQVKGEMSLVTLAAVAFLAARSASARERQHDRGSPRQIGTAPCPSPAPLLSALGSSMALIALRLTRIPATAASSLSSSAVAGTAGHGYGNGNRPPSMVERMIGAFGAVWNAATVAAAGAGAVPLPDGSAFGADSDGAIVARAFSRSVHACLSSLPDAILGSPGGARTRISVDPRSMQAASSELRAAGWRQMWDALQQLNQQQQQQQQQQQRMGETESDALTLSTVHSWSKYLPFPAELVPQVSSIINRNLTPASQDVEDVTNAHHPCTSEVERQHRRKAALACLAAVFEGGAWDVDQVLAQRVGLTENQQHQQSTKKRQSSRSKRRQRELVESSATDEILAESRSEVDHRGRVACWLTFSVWDALLASALRELATYGDSNPETDVDGEGPIGCVAASANASLPFLVRSAPAALSTLGLDPLQLFSAMAGFFQKLCSSPCKSIRSLTFEALYSLQGAIDYDRPLDDGLESLIVEHFFVVRMLKVV
jgi:hypothetical protein